MIGLYESRDVCIKDTERSRESYERYVQFFVKTVTTLEHVVLVAHPLHAIILSLSDRRPQLLTDGGLTPVGFVLIC